MEQLGQMEPTRATGEIEHMEKIEQIEQPIHI